MKLRSNAGIGPNCHIGSPVETPGGTVTCAVKVAVKGADPEMADALMATEQCSTEDGIVFAGGCEVVDTTAAMTTTITTSAVTAPMNLIGVLRWNSSGDGSIEDSPGRSASTGREGTGCGGIRRETSVRTPQYSQATNRPRPGGGSGAPH